MWAEAEALCRPMKRLGKGVGTGESERPSDVATTRRHLETAAFKPSEQGGIGFSDWSRCMEELGTSRSNGPERPECPGRRPA